MNSNQEIARRLDRIESQLASMVGGGNVPPRPGVPPTCVPSLSDQGSGPYQFGGPQCWGCGNFGHIRVNCPNLVPPRSKIGGQGN